MKSILEKTDELVDLIINSKEYQKYLSIKDKMKRDKEIIEKIEKIRILQKEAVKKSSINEAVDELDKEINEKLEGLKQIPIYQEYLNVEEEINIVLQTIKKTIENYINKAVQ